MSAIADIVSKLDTSITDITETRIFNLLHADATEMANLLNGLYGDTSSTNPQNNNNRGNNTNRGGGPGGGGGGGFPFFGGGQQTQASQESARAILESKMVAVPDPRTNSVIVSSSRDMMEEIALTVGRLDSTDSRKQHIHVYSLENADPDNVTSILKGMFTVNGANSPSQTQQNTTDVLTQRTQTGASSDVVNTLSTSGGGGGGGGAGGGRGGAP
jgi:hypothetical protein